MAIFGWGLPNGGFECRRGLTKKSKFSANIRLSDQ